MNYKEIYGDYKIGFKQDIENSTTSEILKINLEILERYWKTIFNDNRENENSKLLNITNKELKNREF